MENKSKLPTIIRRPIQRSQVPSDRMLLTQSSTSGLSKGLPAVGTRFQTGNRAVLTQNFENVCNMMNSGVNYSRTKPSKRHASPEFRTISTVYKKRIRRSRSVGDIDSILSERPPIQKRPLSKLNTNPSKAAKPTKCQDIPKKPLPVGSETTKSDMRKAQSTKSTLKRIPAYDFKSRFNDLNEKHKILKDKHEQLKTKMGEYDSLPEKYEECQTQLSSIQTAYTSTKASLESLQLQSDTEKLQIKALTDKLNTKIEECIFVTEAKSQLLHQYKEIMFENNILKEHKSNLEKESEKYRIATEEKISRLSAELDDTKNQLFLAYVDRKELHNTVMDLRGNIRVFCRVRPPLQSETNRLVCSWNFHDETSLEIYNADNKKSIKHDFNFDHVFGPNAEQTDIFEMVSPLIQSALDGYNVCIFAYGQTGSGKTYTMDGHEGETGIIPRTTDFLFRCFEQYKKLGWRYTLSASFLEIYNEILFDLLSNESKDLDIRMVSAKTPTDIFVSNLTEVEVRNEDELHKLMQMAKSNRATAATIGNERSSRSHAVTQLRLIGEHNAKNEKCIGTINLIDLAGSESPKTSVRMDETKKINKSLSELTNVIMALLQKQEHIPYRNSKLTHLLMPSLGGNSKTLMFVNVSPFQDCFVESVKSLRFAASVNMCKLNKAKKNKCFAAGSLQTNPSISNNMTSSSI